ncbi:MAG: MFS transporter [Acidobacteriota bacterium]|jgi:MFS family permease|nr:MFS transporter [Acidobacteriota bacterium]
MDQDGEIAGGDLRRTQRATLLVSIVTNFVNPFAGTALTVAVPVIGSEFHSSATALSWIVSAYMFCTVSLSVPFGRIADIRGRRRVLVTGIVVFAAMTYLATLAHSMAAFIAFRVLMGIGSAMIFATNIPILISVYPVRMRGKVLGVSVAAVYIGLACGPVIGGIVTQTYGWRTVLVLISVVAFAAFLVAFIWLPKEPGAGEGGESSVGAGGGAAGAGDKKKLSPGSIALYIASMLLFMYGFTTFAQDALSYFILAAGIVVFVFYVRHESRTGAPIVEMRVFRGNLNFLLSNLAALFNYAATFAVGYLLSLYLQLVRGWSADQTGIILICQPLVQTVVSPFAGRLSDRKSPYMLASFGMGCCAAALLSFILVGGDTPVWRIVAGLAVVGFGFGVFSSPNANAIMSSVEPRDFGVASSIQSTARSLGQVIGMALITISTNFIIGKTPIDETPKESIVRTTHVSFIVFAALCAVGVFISLNQKRD